MFERPWWHSLQCTQKAATEKSVHKKHPQLSRPSSGPWDTGLCGSMGTVPEEILNAFK